MRTTDHSNYVIIKSQMITIPHAAPILTVDQGFWGLKDIDSLGFLSTTSKTELAFSSTYTDCVPTDIGKRIKVNGDRIDELVLAYYKNADKIWWLSGSTSSSASIPSGAQITIDNGTGAGTTSAAALVYGGGAIRIGHGFEGPTDVPKIILTDTEQGYNKLYIREANGTTPAHLDLGELTAHGSVKIGDGTIYWQTATTPDVLEMDCGLIVDGALNAAGASINGEIGTTGQITSTLSTGTAPLNVTSTTMCPNLNADKLDGYDATAFLQTSNQYITQVTSPLQVVSHTLSIPQATTSQNGYLSSGDWNTFNNKYGSGSSPSFGNLSCGTINCGTITSTGSLYLSNNPNGYLWNNGGYIRQSGGNGFVADGSITCGQSLTINGAGLYNANGYQIAQGNASDWLRINQNNSWPYGVAAYGNWAFGAGSVAIGYWGSPTSGYVLQANGNAYVTGQLTCNNTWITGSWLNSSSTLYIGGASGAAVTMYMNGNVNPISDNAYGLGSGGNRWAGISAVNGYFSGLSISGGITVSGNSEINWNTYATSNYTNLGGFRFNNTYNNLGIEFKAMTLDFGNGVLYPVMEMLYLHDGTWTGMFRFDMNGDFRYAGSLIAFDYIDDLAALRAITSKTTETGTLIHDPATLKFLQDDKGLYSLSACIGWEISMQQKFLAKHDEHEAHIADLLKRIEALENQLNQKQTTS